MKGVLLFLMLGSCLAATANAAEGPALEWLKNNAPLYYRLVKHLDIKVPENAKMTVLVPSDKAIETFLYKMKLSRQEFLARKGLVDLVLAYHVIPGHQAKSAGEVMRNPTVAATADVNYILRFFKDPGSSRVSVMDVQGRNASVAEGAPVIIGSQSFLPIDKVLMSGAYFFNGLDALKHYPQWSDAFTLAKRAGWPTNDASADLTFFVPDNKALRARMSASLPAAVAKQQLLYHFVSPALHIPHQIKPGKLPTQLKGHDLTVAVSANTKPGAAPGVKIIPEVGPAANVVIYNIYTGKGIIQGIDANLVARVPSPKATAQGQQGAGHHRRALLRWRGGSSGFNQMTANSIAATNTQQAIYAAAEGNIPVGAATRYGSYQAEAAAAYGSGCWNCLNW